MCSRLFMISRLRVIVPALVVAVAGSCATGGEGWNPADAASADQLEMRIDEGGRLVEIEYHMAPDRVPEPVRAAMRDLHPGASLEGAEKEWLDGALYWELAGTRNGRKVEAMFRSDGTLYEQEVEVPADQVPLSARDAVSRAWPAGRLRSWEVISDAEGRVLAYHAKVDDAGRHLKLVLRPDGTVDEILREVRAEIEVRLE